MRFTKRELAFLLFLVGITLLLVMIVTKRERGTGLSSGAPSPRDSGTGLTAMRQGDADGAEPSSTNVSDAADQPAGGEDGVAIADEPEFAERVRRIRPPPSGAGSNAVTIPAASRRSARAATPGLQDTNEIVRILNQLASQPLSPQTLKLFQDTLVKLGAQDPAAALAYALSVDSRRTRLSLLNTLIGNWAQSDANGAYAWALANLQDDAGAMASALRPIFGALAGQNLDNAMLSVWELPAGGGRSVALRAVVEQAVRDGSPGELAAYLAAITDSQESRLFASSLAQNWAVRDPMAAAEWALSLNDSRLRNAALGSVVGSWTTDLPEQAAEWVAQLPAGALRNQQMSRLTQTWAGFDPVGAADWLIEQQPPQPSLDPAVQGLVSTVMRSNPEGAMAWAGAISDPGLRTTTLLQVGKHWLRQNPQQATSYILAASLPPEVRARLLSGK
jgi:hypothetical protein